MADYIPRSNPDSPCIHSLYVDTPTTVAYCGRYVGKNLKLGPYGDPAECTVTV